MQEGIHRQSLSRRGVIAGGAGLAGALLASGAARSQQPNANLGTPASVLTNPPRDWSSHNPSIYPDPDVIIVDPSFTPLRRYQGANLPGLDRRAMGRRSRLVEPGQVRRVQRRFGQRSVPLHLG